MLVLKKLMLFIVHKERFDMKSSKDCPEVPETSKAHAVIPHSKNVVQLKKYSDNPRGEYLYYGPPEEVNEEDLKGFVFVRHEDS